MNFYEKIKNSDAQIPDNFGMRANQMLDFACHARDNWELICIVFKFGYMQGIRAERAGKAVL